MKYFGSNNVEGVAESWMEAEMSWVEVGGAGWRLKLAGWRWVHGLVIPDKVLISSFFKFQISTTFSTIYDI